MSSRTRIIHVAEVQRDSAEWQEVEMNTGTEARVSRTLIF